MTTSSSVVHGSSVVAGGVYTGVVVVSQSTTVTVVTSSYGAGAASASLDEAKSERITALRNIVKGFVNGSNELWVELQRRISGERLKREDVDTEG